MMSRWMFPIIIFLFFCCKTERVETAKPNVIILLVDDLGYHDLPDYGSTFHETPNISELASSSTRFTNAYAPAAICSPSRASILTGRYTTTLGITDFIRHTDPRTDSTKILVPAPNGKMLDTSFTTLASVLSQNGYRTASIGKWHLGGEGSLPEDHGFQVNVAGNHRGMPPTFYHPYYPEGGDPVIPNLDKNDKEGEYLTDRITQEAIQFIDDNRSEPFFLYLPYFTVHIPIEGRMDLVGKFEAKADVLGLDSANVHYAAMVAAMDESIGKILAKLNNHNLSENTLIILSSDNGGLHRIEGLRTPATDNGALREGKGWLYEGGIKVPLYLHKPGQVTEKEEDTPVNLIGIFPTVLEALGVESDVMVDGTSFCEEIEKKPLYWHYPHYSNQGGKPSSAIREGRYKLIYWYETESAELFDLENDPSESENLIGELPDVGKNLQRKLDAWLQETGALYPIKIEK